MVQVQLKIMKRLKAAIIGYFYGITQERLTKFCDWISNPDDEFELPNFNNYLDVIKEEVPPIKNLIEKHY